MLATLCFLTIAIVLDYFPSSIKGKNIKALKNICTNILSFYAFYTLKCFCLRGQIWDYQPNFVMNYDKCSFSKENEDDSTLISALNFTFYFLIDDRVNYIVSIFLLIKIWYFTSPNEKWLDHSLYNLMIWHFAYHFKTPKWDFYIMSRAIIILCFEETLRADFYPTKLELYQDLSKLKLIFKFLWLFACRCAETVILIFCVMYYEQIYNFGKDIGMYAYEQIYNFWKDVSMYVYQQIYNFWKANSEIIFEGIYTTLWIILTQIYYFGLIRFIKFTLSISHKKGKNINEVIIFATLTFWGIFKIISLVLFYNGIVLLLEHYYYVPSFFIFYHKILIITIFGHFLSYPKMIKNKKWKLLCVLDFSSILLSVYFLEYIWYLLYK